MRNTLGFKGQKDPMKRYDSTINVEIYLHRAAARNLEVIIWGNKGTIMSMYEYKVMLEEANRKIVAADRDIDLESTSKKKSKILNLKFGSKNILNE